MKHRYFSLICSIGLATSGAAQGVRRGAIEVRSADGSEITVSIDNRRYEKVSRRLVIGDLSTGRHRLRVYAVYPNRRDGGAEAESVYSAVFFAERGSLVQCEVDVRKGTGRIRTVDAVAAPARTTAAPVYAPAPARAAESVATPSSFDLDALKRQVDAREGDAEKMETMRNAISGRSIRTADVQAMLSWLAFDSSRIEFAKAAYPSVTDRANYGSLESAFTFENSKKDLAEFIRSNR